MFFIFRRVGIASAFALAAVLLWFRRVDTGNANGHVATVPVVVAARDIRQGEILDRMALVVASWPVGTQPAGAFGGLDSVAGRVSRVDIYKGEAIVPGRLAPKGTGPGILVRITPGKRAYGIRINDVTAMPGLIQPNSRVDVMVVIHDSGSSRRVAKLFMSNMRVLAIGGAPARQESGRPVNATVVTLEVTPQEAERLAIATSQGELQLVLRGYGDPDSVRTWANAPMAVQPRVTRDRMPVFSPTSPQNLRRDTARVRP